MSYFWMISGILLAIIWLDRLRDAFTGRHIDDLAEAEWDPAPGGLATLSIVVAARNEGAHVRAALCSLLEIDYPGLEVIAIDDRSTDDTGTVMDGLAAQHSLRPGAKPLCAILHVRSLPPGWLGKPHAMWLGARQAKGDWLLFTDADVRFRRDALRRAVAYAEGRKIDHLVVVPTHELRSPAERLMLATFSMLFLFGHRPWKVGDPKARDFLGFGPFNLIRRSVYERIGGAEKLRMEIIEDMKLGKLVKEHGFRQCLAYGTGLLPWRWFHGGLDITRVLRKNLFASMNYRYGKAAGACLAILLLAVLPYTGVVFAQGWAKAGHAIAVATILGLFIGMSRRWPISPIYFVLYPVGTLVLAYAMACSIAHVIRHGGVVWRGTLYPLDELRKGLV